MKVYIITTGTVFGLLALAHIWRVTEEGWHLARDPSFVLITVAAAALCLWAWRLIKRSSRS
jgi:tellurite resistance protein TehA-like permease